ncbi:autophagy-related protein 16-1-like [Amphibalanus amphitrite]|uniref:autophagy-related protein 16-1-like n=1 Tax=Amphibalanus amphitrite TaxID=1232801 RepID=UPI001C91B6DA|nr:autophagy-related protein 16-1-like [Amphibalanus amphitrite]XP_043189273.1 autophagy-related protein 16-1-like [Amphibalanus amphitrite]XP_043189274.1 autophagy-related protein 16-1-like [Amphibalanus amphitrite]XP_043189275.1 autophagy-related protein 16-1-like [Amphibalanus amphitrite]
MAELPKWREKIVDALRERDMRQVECFRGLINDYNRLFEGADSLRQNINRTLFQERAVGGHQISGDAGPALAAATEKIQVLEQKQVHMLEELTSLHRRRGENAQMIVDLNSDLAKLRQQLAATDQLLAESTADCETLKERIAALEQTNSELNATNQTLKDEYNALHLIYMQMEKNFKEAQTERDSLLARCLEIKSNVAEKMNQENEEFVRRRQLRVQRELEDATRDVVVVPPDTSRVAACIEAALPTKSITSFDAHESEVNALAWSPSGGQLASGGSDRKVKLWTVRGGQYQLMGQYTGCNKGINSVAFDDEETLLLAAGNDLASRVWGVADFRLRYTLTGHSGPVMVAKFLGSNTKVITGSRDRTLKGWDLQRGGDCVMNIFANSICFDIVDGVGATNLLSGHYDSTIKVWDTRDSREPKHVIKVDGHVTSLAQGTEFRVLCCTRADTLKVVDLRTMTVARNYEADGFHVACDYSRAVFSPDCKYVAAGSGTGDLFIWNESSRRLEKHLPAVSSPPSCVLATAWHPEGSCLVSSDKAKRITVWSDI